MKALLWVSVGISGLLALSFLYFLHHGYAYTLQAYDKPSHSQYVYSPECTAMQQKMQTLTAPIEVQMEPLANRLINGPYPIVNGQALYNQYAALRDRLDRIETQYGC